MTTLHYAPLLSLLICACLMAVVWRLQQRTGNAGWVDVAWAGLLGAQALFYGASVHNPHWSIWLGLGLAMVWSGRLTLYLARRVAGEAEDGRYQALRAHWGAQAQQGFFWFFQAQALVAWLLALPFYQLSRFPALAEPGPHWPVWLGLALGLLAIAGETSADCQLSRHRRQHPGLTCRSGWWRYSRHPKYFFEWLHWWAYPLLAWGTPWGWSLWLAPALMLLFLYRITGIPHTEHQALKSRGADYRRYQRETSAFIPWPVRRVKAVTPSHAPSARRRS